MKPTQISSKQIVRLKVTLNDIKPVIWRRVEVPLTISLLALHEVIQAVMLFENYHLFEFVTGKRGYETRYAIPDPNGDFAETFDARKTTLAELTEAGITRMIYTYDFGDDWRHTVEVESVTAADPAIDYPHFIEGANHAPPEDVGGQPGFENFLHVMAKPKPKHPEYADIKQWYGRPFDPTDINQAEIATRMAKLAKRQKTKKSATTKPKLN